MEFLNAKREMLRRYDSVKGESANRPVMVDHGVAAEAIFREWIEGFLPAAYGVTRGFVIPDIQQPNYVLREYDLIVFDAINSPVLWVSSNPSSPTADRKRAIPAEYVLAVAEVKATFNAKSIGEATRKLSELSAFRDYLHKNFLSFVVFFEVVREQQTSCRIVEELTRSDAPGYFGGLILRAEGFDEDLAGYLQFTDGSKATEPSMPVIRDIAKLLVDDERGGLQISLQGDVAEIVWANARINYNLGYAPNVKGASLAWSHNSFPRFALHLLDRLRGLEPRQRTTYGLSFLE
ncbi:MAG TPA: DUF6602 domain-containing protein [Gemmatimonadaceae bacterium]